MPRLSSFPFVLLLPPLFLQAQPPDWTREIAGKEEWVEYVAERTGEPVEILAASMRIESNGKAGSVGYCTKWVPAEEEGKIICKGVASCYKNCQRPAVWSNRLDIGIWQLRDVPLKVRGVPTVGWSWLRWYRENVDKNAPDDCPLDPQCASDVMVAVVNHLNADYKPKKCRKSRWPDHVGA